MIQVLIADTVETGHGLNILRLHPQATREIT